MEQAVILAAGEGQRLRPLTVLKPKVMIPIADKPILQYVVEALAVNGVRHIIMVVGYRKEQVQDYFGSGEKLGVEIDYIVQKQQLGTAHALMHAKDAVADRFLVLPGDNIIKSDTIAPLVEAKPSIILVKKQENVSKYGVVTARKGTVEEIVEKPQEATSNLVNTGIYSLDRGMFEFVEEEVELPMVLNSMIARGYEIAAQETDGIWLDAVYPWDILRLNDIALGAVSLSTAGTVEKGVTMKGAVSIGKGTVIRAGSYLVGPLIIGENAEIGPHACIFPATSIGDQVTISPFSQIRNSAIGNGVHIGPGSILEDSIVDRGSVLGGHFTAFSAGAVIEVEGEYYNVHTGTVVGEHCAIEENVTARPGVILGNNSRVSALKLLSGKIPDGSLVV
ncbi:MAG: glucose-1-phosphate thymidylyltransferase [Dehalococcoidia bacterium]|nr:MAG: glucose-1-phosphate thymidylyltransferase [Dehalococcoidia bacterium]